VRACVPSHPTKNPKKGIMGALRKSNMKFEETYEKGGVDGIDKSPRRAYYPTHKHMC